MELDQVIIMPYVTEKTEALKARSKGGQILVFKVLGGASKESIRQAIHKIYQVNALKVNIVNTPSRQKRFRNTYTRKSGFKKAIVTLEPGKTIEFSR